MRLCPDCPPSHIFSIINAMFLNPVLLLSVWKKCSQTANSAIAKGPVCIFMGGVVQIANAAHRHSSDCSYRYLQRFLTAANPTPPPAANPPQPCGSIFLFCYCMELHCIDLHTSNL